MEYSNVMFPIPLKKPFVTHCLPFNQHELHNAVKNIKEKMESNSRKNHQQEELIMIDSIQRLGLQHYFQKEIHAALERYYANFCSFEQDSALDLHEVALTFRLLRQDGYNVTADVFNKFKNKEGRFEQQNGEYNLKGLMSLFEASQLSTEGEYIMEEAAEFSKQILKKVLKKSNKGTVVEKALKNPRHRSLAKIVTESILKDYEASFELLHGLTHVSGWVKDVHNLARIHSNLAQITRRKELLRISIWGEELNLRKEMQFARIQPLKWYIWSLGILPWLNRAEERVELAKAGAFIFMIDDIFDIQGTIHDLSIFTEAVYRWDQAEIEHLPGYMQVCFKGLCDMVANISHRTHILYGWNPQNSLQKLWGDLCKSFLDEAKWLDSEELPSSEEYLKNGIISSAVPVILMHVFFLLGKGITQITVDALDAIPPIVSSVATVVRLSNDIGTDKEENRDGKDGSYIDCYIKEHNNLISAKSAREDVNLRISDAWKCLNKEYFSTTSSSFSAEFKEACLNFARMASTMYSFDERDRLFDLQQHLNFTQGHSLN